PPPPQPGAINIEKKVRNISDNETSFVESTDADPNEIVEFQIQVPVTNTVHNITVSDVLPNRLNYVNNSLTVNNASAGNNLNSVVIGTATNTTKTVKFRATVADASQFSSGNTELINVASVTSDAGNKTDTAKVIVHKQAVVANINIDKQVRNVSDNQSSFANSTNADPGEQVEFQLRVNTNGAVNNISVSDVLPGRLIYVNNSLRVDGAGAGNNLGGISLGSINSSTKTITFRANVAEASQFSTGNTTLTNIANLSSSAGSDSDSADVIVTKNPPQNTQTTLGIHKTVRNASVNPNGTFVESVEARKDEIVEFKIVVTNTGSLTANNVRLQDTLPNNPTLNYVSGSLRIDGNTSSVDVINNYGIIGDLTPGQSRTVTFKASVPTVTANQTVTNVATTFASNANSVSDTAQVVLIPVLSGHVNLVYSKKAFNNTQNKDATKVAAKPGDTITYTLTVQNTGTLDATLFVIEDNVLDIFQLSDPTNLNGGTYNFGSHVLSWPAVTVQANGGKVERTFSVRVKNPIPSGSDYVMTNVYGNEVKINIHKPGPYVAPKTGSAGTLSFTFALLTVGGFFLYRRYKAGKQLFGWVR
ncbi:MAG TPA: hypothetical protein VEB42_12800, partial [Chitinophagaceae bacterium]|nr:hypothetical protein [Chitinophagaceae bacterium]